MHKNSSTIETTKSGEISIKKIIIKCPECRQKIRAPLFRTKKLSITCPNCNTKFRFDCNKYRFTQFFINTGLMIAIIILICLNIASPIVYSSTADKSISHRKTDYENKIKQTQISYDSELKN